ncbi:MAG: fatty acid oxidation complex subunit alpha [Planctomycetota bacterium]|nr:MAG: fatty acid oxidation complex subunit alpha [Planctomycetota bacterium]
MDIRDFPAPDDAPAPGACVKLERPEAGLVVLRLDPPHRKLPVLDAPMLRDLDDALNALAADSTLRALVITGRDPRSFAAGADVQSIAQVTDAAVVERLVHAVHRMFRTLERLPARTVCAAGGAVPGGAFELALSCDLILLSDDPGTRIGLPETKLGILPGWGGTHRLTRRVGVPTALDLILAGKLVDPKRAKRLGMVDRLTKPEFLERIACDLAMGRLPFKPHARGAKHWLVDRNPLARWVIGRTARKQLQARTNGHYPAPEIALEMILRAPGVSMLRAAELEASAVAPLAVSPVCKALVGIFFASEEAKKTARLPNGEQAAKLERGAVIGAGVMGGAIASLMAEKGVSTRLIDQAPEALDAAERAHRKAIAKKLAKRRTSRAAADHAIDSLDTSRGMRGLARCELVLEAVAERLEVKQAVFGAVAEQVSAEAILATNTSSLSVDAIAANLPHPERVVGLHFFNPVRAMPLVEVVRGAATSPDVLARTCALAVRLGKTPVVTADRPGFIVNRLLGPYLDEALRLAAGGAPVARIDAALLDFGMPMGPFRLLDEVGLDIARHAAASLHAAYGERMQPSDALERLPGADGDSRLGRKTKHGFYRFDDNPRADPELADDLAALVKQQDFAALSEERIAERLVLVMLNEAARLLHEGVVDSAGELDLATVFGMGFAPFRGGLLHHADAVGLERAVEQLRALAEEAAVIARAPGAAERFAPCELLRDMAERDSRFFPD